MIALVADFRFAQKRTNHKNSERHEKTKGNNDHLTIELGHRLVSAERHGRCLGDANQ
jgi:hypothetical protein